MYISERVKSRRRAAWENQNDSRRRVPLRQGLFGHGLQILGGNGIVGALAIPGDAENPPARPVVEQFDTVDAALEGFARGVMTGSIAGEDVCDVAELLGTAGNLLFVKSMLLEV